MSQIERARRRKRLKALMQRWHQLGFQPPFDGQLVETRSRPRGNGHRQMMHFAQF